MIEAEINSLEDDLRTIKSETVTQLESFQSQQNQVRNKPKFNDSRLMIFTGTPIHRAVFLSNKTSFSV